MNFNCLPRQWPKRQKVAIATLTVVLLMLCGISAFCYGSWLGLDLVAQVGNPVGLVAIASSFSLLLLAGVYYSLYLLFTNAERIHQELLAEIAQQQQRLAENSELIRSLQESEERFRVVLKISPIIVSNQDQDLRYTWVYNPASGVDGVTLVGKLDTELFVGENAEQIIPIKRRVLTTGIGERKEICITVDGQMRYYDLTVEPLWNQEREVIGITCAAANITEVRQREQKLRAIFEQTLDAIAIADDQGYYVEVNPAAEQLFGESNSELIGLRIGDFIEPGFDFELAWQTFLQVGQLTGEICLHLRDGTVKYVEYAAKANFIPGRHLSFLRDITERKQTEQKLQYRQALLTSILNTLPVGIWVTDEQGVIRQGNPAGQKIWAGAKYLGVNQYQQYKGWWQDTGKLIEPQEWALARAITKGETSINEVITIECFDGTQKTILNSAMPLRNERQEIIGAMAVNQDITELKQAEQALCQTQHLIQKITDTTPNLLYIYDQIQNCNIYANRQTEEFFGLTQTEIQAQGGQFITEVLHPEDLINLPNTEEIFATADDGELIESEIRFKNANGEWRWLHLWEVIFSRNAEGKPAQILGTAIDITERKQLEAKLATSEELLRTALEAAQMGTWDWNITAQVTGSADEHNFSGLEVVNETLIGIIHPEDRDLVLQAIQDTIQNGSNYDIEFRVILPNGDIRWQAHKGRVFHDETGRPVRMAGVDLDITERKKAEEIRRQLEREQELSQLRRRFFSLASHEFRTPLSTILASAQLMQLATQEWSEEKRHRNIYRIEVAAKRIRQLLDDILTINRAETGRLDFNPVPMNIDQFCQKIVTDIQSHLADQNQISFVSHCQSQTGYLDQKLMHDILSNLLNNARKYSPANGEIHLTLTCTPAEIRFQIRDWGIGILPSDLPHVFEAFYRGENIGSIPGSGLGLTVAKNCVDVHGGSISVTSEVGVGTTFTVIIPQSSTCVAEGIENS